MDNNRFHKQEKRFLDWVDVDYVALAEIAGLYSLTHYPRPQEKEYLQALELIKYLMYKYEGKIKCLKGPELYELRMTPEELTNWLKEMWYSGKYNEIDYGIWFELDLPEEEMQDFEKPKQST